MENVSKEDSCKEQLLEVGQQSVPTDHSGREEGMSSSHIDFMLQVHHMDNVYGQQQQPHEPSSCHPVQNQDFVHDQYHQSHSVYEGEGHAESLSGLQMKSTDDLMSIGCGFVNPDIRIVKLTSYERGINMYMPFKGMESQIDVTSSVPGLITCLTSMSNQDGISRRHDEIIISEFIQIKRFKTVDGIGKTLQEKTESMDTSQNVFEEYLTSLRFCQGIYEEDLLYAIGAEKILKLPHQKLLIELASNSDQRPNCVDTKKRIIYKSRTCLQIIEVPQPDDIHQSARSFPEAEDAVSAQLHLEAACAQCRQFFLHICDQLCSEDIHGHEAADNTRRISIKKKCMPCITCGRHFPAKKRVQRRLAPCYEITLDSPSDLHSDEIKEENLAFSPVDNLTIGKIKSGSTMLDFQMKTCPFCSDQFKIKKGYLGSPRFRHHLNSVHLDYSQNSVFQDIMAEKLRTTIKCDICEKHFVGKKTLRRHKMVQHCDKASQLFEGCNICGKSFKVGSSSLWSHKKTHELEKYICTVCGSTFKLKSSLNRHMKSHDANGKRFECKICEEKFSQPYLLKQHQEFTHNKKLPFKCQLCSQTLRSRTFLKIHMRSVHEKDKPFPCEECIFKSSRMDNLNKHRLKVHNKKTKLTRKELISLIQQGCHPFCKDGSQIPNF